MKQIIPSILIVLLSFFIVSCGQRGNKNNIATSSEKVEVVSNNGTYSYLDNSVELEITISGDYWSSKTKIITGAGSVYDNENTQYENGILKGDDIYEGHGIVEVGYVSGNNLTMYVGGHSTVTLHKN
jgi:hypothetical protein